jgi:tripartite-type tricarboxylate transporter receptor subunit TctC
MAYLRGLALLTLITAALPAAAQNYPNRPVQMIVAFPAGGAVDVMGRAFADNLSALLGQQYVIVNKDGAAGVIGFTQLAQARPDGYTLGFGPTTPITGAPLLVKNVPYGFGDFEYVCQVFENIFTVAVPKASPYRTLAELLDAARAAPGKLTYGHAGLGTVPHLSIEALAKKADVHVVGVPFRGDAPMLVQLQAGQIDFGAPAVGTIAQQDPRVLMVFGDKRHPHYPDIPVATELGFPYMPPGLNGIFAPKHTPEPILERLERACDEATHSDRFRQIAATLYQPIVYLTRREFAARARLDYEFKTDVIRTAKITGE